MKLIQNFYISLLFVVSLFVSSAVKGHGFAGDIPISLCDKKRTVYLSDVCWRAVDRDWGQWCIASYDREHAKFVHGNILRSGVSITPSYIRLTYGDKDGMHAETITFTPLQEFCLYETRKWIPAYKLKQGDRLVSLDEFRVVSAIEHIIAPYKVFLFEVENTHTFFVGRFGLLTHNMV